MRRGSRVTKKSTRGNRQARFLTCGSVRLLDQEVDISFFIPKPPRYKLLHPRPRWLPKSTRLLSVERHSSWIGTRSSSTRPTTFPRTSSVTSAKQQKGAASLSFDVTHFSSEWCKHTCRGTRCCRCQPFFRPTCPERLRFKVSYRMRNFTD